MAYTFLDWQTDFRRITGKRTTSQMSLVDVKKKLNTFYRLMLPRLISPPEFKGWYTFNTVASTGEYTLPATVIAVSGPVYLDDERIDFYTDRELFFDEYPMDETDEDSPLGVLLFDRTLYVRKIPDDVYAVKMRMVSSTPTELVNDSDTPENELWGRLVVYGAAIETLSDDQDMDAVENLTPLFMHYKSMINVDIADQFPIGMRSVPLF